MTHCSVCVVLALLERWWWTPFGLMPGLAIVPAAEHNSHSLQHWSVNICRTYLKGGFAYKCDDQFVDLVSPVLFCALASSREGIKSLGGSDTMEWASELVYW